MYSKDFIFNYSCFELMYKKDVYLKEYDVILERKKESSYSLDTFDVISSIVDIVILRNNLINFSNFVQDYIKGRNESEKIIIYNKFNYEYGYKKDRQFYRKSNKLIENFSKYLENNGITEEVKENWFFIIPPLKKVFNKNIKKCQHNLVHKRFFD